MLRNLQSLNRPQRVLVFILLFGGALLALLAVSAALILGALNSNARLIALPQTQGVTVREFTVLPDNEAYPAAVAVAPDGRVYTGSYKTGAIYAISPDGAQVAEVPGSREAVGAAAGLAFAPDGSLLIVDHLDADVRTSGGLVKRMTSDGQFADFATISDERGFVLPHEITLDGQGNVYVSDRGRDEVWRFNPDGSGGVAWWQSPTEAGNRRGYDPTGLAYDPTQDTIIITDGAQDIIYRVSVADAATDVLYQHTGQADAPGFDGVTVTSNGVIYVAALGVNRIVRLDNGVLLPVAGPFRGASDVAHAPPNRLYVTNFDQFSLVVPAIGPRLPFALDVIELGGS
ncbi:MAG: SMP-30/gluconolactonase/LRE family protein [Chloroflexi bacterium]|nr:SMP-30/gluconolactonase/LRE family protein [Chloroflexota bacterium]